MSPWAILAALLVVGVLAGAAYRQGREDGEDKIVAQQTRESELAAKATDAAASAIAAAIPKITVTHQTVRQELEREIRTNPVYLRADCDTGPDSLQRFNAAIPGTASAAAVPGRGAVPASGAGD